MARYQIRHSELQTLHQADTNCVQQLLPESLGGGHSSSFQLDDGLTYIDSLYTPNKNLSVSCQVDNPEPKLVMTLGLEGGSRFSTHTGSDIIFKQGYTTITSAGSSMGEREYEAGQSIHQLRLTLNKQWLNRYLGEEQASLLVKPNNLQLLSCRPMAHQSLLAVKQLISCDEHNPIRALAMHTQAMSILTAELLPLFQAEKQIDHKQSEQELVYLARDILYKNFKVAPTVNELAKQVGTNSFKLKKLFHQHLQTTPYGLLLSIRMEKAYALLESSSQQVLAVADAVGYAHASNFSTAFIKYFGVAPKQVTKKIRRENKY